jgi:chromosome segregation ATPase
MTNEEKILQILSEMNGRLAHVEQEAVTTNDRLAHVEQRLTNVEQEAANTNEKLTRVEYTLTNVKQEVAKTNLKIENDVMKRLNLLTDGYMLSHEKQYELERKFERKIEELEKRIEQLEIKAS